MDPLQLPDSVSTNLSADISILNLNTGSQRMNFLLLLQGLNYNCLWIYFLLHYTVN